MAYIGKNGKTVGKKNRSSQIYQPLLNKNLVFAHKANLGDRSIDLTALNTPAELSANGFIQASTSDILGAKLAQSRGRLKLVSSIRGDLIDFLHYTIPSSSKIVFLPTAGFEQDEIITGSFESNSDMVPVSGKRIVKTYTLPVGQTTVNLGNEYKVNENSLENVGQILVWINGSLAFRNTGNSDSILDKQYYEVDSGNGYGTTIELNLAPSIDPYEISVDFGHRSITDQNSIGAIESLSGSMIKIAEDLAQLAGTSKEDYVTTSPSEVERRTFGDSVLDLVSRFDLSGTLSSLFNLYTKTRYQTKILAATISATTADIAGLRFSNLTIGKTYRLSGQANLQSNVPDGQAKLTVKNGATVIAVAIHDQSSGGSGSIGQFAISALFVATSTGISSDVGVIAGGGLAGDGTANGSFLTIEELPNHEITNAWT
ncbi:hypothetical protein MASR1M48_16290 [Lactococcus petauri]